MNLSKIKKSVLTKMPILLALLIRCNSVFATGIGTAEVQTATENIKRVITSIAMPLRRRFNICKHSSCSNKNDSKCK